jgi:16S rRNA (uracil1498-N3)-methyltransferase
LRLGPRDALTVTDGCGLVASCEVVVANEGRVRARVLERTRGPAQSPEIAVYQGAPKGTKSDVVVERLAEVGVRELRFFDSRRAVAKWDAGRRARLVQRWEALARAAAKRARNPYVMSVMEGDTSMAWGKMIACVRAEPHAIVLWEEARAPLRPALPVAPTRIALVVGPEGGLDAAEARELRDAGAAVASLGPLILRTENAALVAVSALLWHFGRIG